MPFNPGTNYYVRARHRSLNDKVSAWSPGITFKTAFNPTTSVKIIPGTLVANAGYPTQMEGSSNNYNFVAGLDEADGGKMMFYRKAGAGQNHNLTKTESRPSGTTDLRQFGKAVAMSDNGYWIITAQRNPTTHQMRINLYEYGAGSTWNFATSVTIALVTDAEVTSIAITSTGTLIFVGTPYSNGGAGQVHVYERTGSTTAVHRQTINNPHPSENNQFGYRVATNNGAGRIMVSAPGGPGNGSVYALNIPSPHTSHTVAKRITSPGEANFGRSLYLSRANSSLKCVIGARSSNQPGKVYVHSQETADAWTLTGTLTSSMGGNGDNFGVSACISQDGTRVIVGAVPDNNDSGNVHAYLWSGSAWNLVKLIVPTDSHGGDKFGQSLWLSSDGLEMNIGCPGNNNAQGNGAGAIHRILWSSL